jgi:hypothetical protein
MACEKFPEAILFSPSAIDDTPVDKLSVPILKAFAPVVLLLFPITNEREPAASLLYSGVVAFV